MSTHPAVSHLHRSASEIAFDGRLDGVAAAFDALGDPEAHAKILINPKSDATMPG